MANGAPTQPNRVSTVASWRVAINGVLDFGWSDESAGTRITELVGLEVLDVEPQSPRMKGDPAFRLSGGRWIEMFSDHPVDPWVLMLPKNVFVGRLQILIRLERHSPE